MGLFDKVFKNERNNEKEDVAELPWNPLTDIKQLDEIDAESEHTTVAILKHSTRCGISRMVLRKFENAYREMDAPEVKLYFLDLLSFRQVSNEIAQRYQVHHESPQLLIIKNGKVVFHTSHHAIEAAALKEY